MGLWAYGNGNPIVLWEYLHGGKQKKSNRTLTSSVELAVSLDKDAICYNKRFCKEMTSCEEAKFYLTQCGLSRLDGDGVPLRNCVDDRIFKAKDIAPLVVAINKIDYGLNHHPFKLAT